MGDICVALTGNSPLLVATVFDVFKTDAATVASPNGKTCYIYEGKFSECRLDPQTFPSLNSPPATSKSGDVFSGRNIVLMDADNHWQEFSHRINDSSEIKGAPSPSPNVRRENWSWLELGKHMYSKLLKETPSSTDHDHQSQQYSCHSVSDVQRSKTQLMFRPDISGANTLSCDVAVLVIEPASGSQNGEGDDEAAPPSSHLVLTQRLLYLFSSGIKDIVVGVRITPTSREDNHVSSQEEEKAPHQSPSTTKSFKRGVQQVISEFQRISGFPTQGMEIVEATEETSTENQNSSTKKLPPKKERLNVIRKVTLGEHHTLWLVPIEVPPTLPHHQDEECSMGRNGGLASAENGVEEILSKLSSKGGGGGSTRGGEGGGLSLLTKCLDLALKNYSLYSSSRTGRVVSSSTTAGVGANQIAMKRGKATQFGPTDAPCGRLQIRYCFHRLETEEKRILNKRFLNSNFFQRGDYDEKRKDRIIDHHWNLASLTVSGRVLSGQLNVGQKVFLGPFPEHRPASRVLKPNPNSAALAYAGWESHMQKFGLKYSNHQPHGQKTQRRESALKRHAVELEIEAIHRFGESVLTAPSGALVGLTFTQGSVARAFLHHDSRNRNTRFLRPHRGLVLTAGKNLDPPLPPHIVRLRVIVPENYGNKQVTFRSSISPPPSPPPSDGLQPPVAMTASRGEKSAAESATTVVAASSIKLSQQTIDESPTAPSNSNEHEKREGPPPSWRDRSFPLRSGGEYLLVCGAAKSHVKVLSVSRTFQPSTGKTLSSRARIVTPGLGADIYISCNIRPTIDPYTWRQEPVASDLFLSSFTLGSEVAQHHEQLLGRVMLVREGGFVLACGLVLDVEGPPWESEEDVIKPQMILRRIFPLELTKLILGYATKFVFNPFEQQEGN